MLSWLWLAEVGMENGFDVSVVLQCEGVMRW